MALHRGDREALFYSQSPAWRPKHPRAPATPSIIASFATCAAGGASFNDMNYRERYGCDKKQSYQNIKYVHRSASLHKQAADKMHQKGHYPGNNALPEHNVDRPLTAKLAPDGRDGCNAGRV